MERITSFTIDHDKLEKGMYISRIDFDDIVTYDIRMKKPNGGDYLTSAQAHSFEHIFATYVRNSKWKNNIIYAGPMGCLTGFYLVLKAVPHSEAIKLVKDSCEFISTFEGEIPGATKPECGNYLLQDLPAAKEIAADMLSVLNNWAENDLKYKHYL